MGAGGATGAGGANGAGGAGGAGGATGAGGAAAAGDTAGKLFHVALISSINCRATTRVDFSSCVVSSGGGTSTTARAIDCPPRVLIAS